MRDFQSYFRENQTRWKINLGRSTSKSSTSWDKFHFELCIARFYTTTGYNVIFPGTTEDRKTVFYVLFGENHVVLKVKDEFLTILPTLLKKVQLCNSALFVQARASK